MSDFAALVGPEFDHPPQTDDDKHTADCGEDDDNRPVHDDGDKDNEGIDDITGWSFLTGTPPKSSKYKKVNLG